MKVCVDPGHGMSNRQMGVYDPGATHTENGFKFEEASIALQYALSLREALRSRGAEVFMTRDDATDHTSVGMRAVMAKQAGCDVFVSLHLNDFDDDAANGTEVIYGSDGSKFLADRLLKELVATTGMKSRGTKLRKDLAVLKFPGTAVLIELGFIANDGDREKMLNVQLRDAMAKKIAEIICP